MDVDVTKGHEAEKPRKPYHSPELSVLGPIQSVVHSSPGMGGDMGTTVDTSLS
jgi:hypothetical protein